MIIAFAGPATLIFVATFIYPIIRTIVMSFFSIQEITDATDKWKFNGIGNYISLMETPLYRTSWINLFKIFIIGRFTVAGSHFKKWSARQEIFSSGNLSAQCN